MPDTVAMVVTCFVDAERTARRLRAQQATLDAWLVRARDAGATYDVIAAAIIAATDRDPSADAMRRIVDTLRQRFRRHRRRDGRHAARRDTCRRTRQSQPMPQPRDPTLVERITEHERTIERFEPEHAFDGVDDAPAPSTPTNDPRLDDDDGEDE